MKRTVSTILLGICLLVKALAADPGSNAYKALHQLAHELHLKQVPTPQKNTYEIRIWQKEQLIRGAAQKLYLVKKTKRHVQLIIYQIYAGEWKERRRVRMKLVDSPFWNQLVQQDILTLPDQAAIDNKLRPKPKKDSTWTVLGSDGGIVVKARKREPILVIGDGEIYYFEVFSSDGHREYSYNNPKSYVELKPIAELQKVVAILNELDSTFAH